MSDTNWEYVVVNVRKMVGVGRFTAAPFVPGMGWTLR